MSSLYRAICLNHQPALELDEPTWQDPAAALHAIGRREDEHLAPHHSCQLLIARYSGGLTELGCPASSRCGHPHDAEWVDTTWLRLAATTLNASDPATQTALRRLPRCWNTDRLNRLQHILDITPAPAAPPVTADQIAHALAERLDLERWERAGHPHIARDLARETVTALTTRH